MKIKKLLYTVFLVLFVFNAIAQTAKLTAAEAKYGDYAYIDAIATYEKVAQKGYQDEKMFQKLGNAYYFNGESTIAVKWYDALFAMNAQQEPEYYYRYAQTLKSTGNYAKADQMLAIFNKKAATDKRGLLFEKNKNYLETIKSNSGRFTIADAGINSSQTDYGSAFLGTELVFASARDTGGVAKRKFKWTNKSFTNLYSVTLNEDGSVGTPKRFERNVNSKFNESTPVFTKDGKTMYFTRNNFLDGKRKSDDKKITLLKLYKTILEDGEWVNITELPFNSDQYSVAHPALSGDEKTLYFSSDMPGTAGQSDLFSVAINADGSFGIPKNLGPAINTEGRETFPFVSAENELFFASDGRPGLGGLDIYVTKIGADNNFSEIQNVGAPVNGSEDDFAFLIDSDSKNGFFTSNRTGGKGYDDIYRFTQTRKLSCEQALAGIISDQESGKPLSNAKVRLLDDQFQFLKEGVTDSQGNYSFEVACGKTYYVRAEKQDYETKEAKIAIPATTGKTDLPLALEKRIKAIGVGTDLAKTLNIPIIYFDLDKSAIRKDAAFELEKVLAVMQQYPKMKIDVRSHTDSRQTAKYNTVLSNKRANATMAWLLKNGIERSRLTAKGYGESQLLNNCGDGVKCSEEEHQLNRRSEFIIVSME
jgi:outer membrane protein OmpA-like peptidoglycan-associated protein/tetratricopeptide (TPR) repeat protein